MEISKKRLDELRDKESKYDMALKKNRKRQRKFDNKSKK